MNYLRTGFLITATIVLFACAHTTPTDYSAYKRSDPKSILILPPVNSSPDVEAGYSFYSHTQKPLAEAGYYVFPITLVDETFKNNGYVVANDIHEINIARLRQVFGADAALYINVEEYGTQYLVIDTKTTVAASAQLVDLLNGEILWEDKVRISGEGLDLNLGGFGVLGILASAVAEQIANTATNQGYKVAKQASGVLLTPNSTDGILYGPRNPLYENR